MISSWITQHDLAELLTTFKTARTVITMYLVDDWASHNFDALQGKDFNSKCHVKAQEQQQACHCLSCKLPKACGTCLSAAPWPSDSTLAVQNFSKHSDSWERMPCNCSSADSGSSACRCKGRGGGRQGREASPNVR